MKFGETIHVALRMKPGNFADPTMFPPLPPAGQNVVTVAEVVVVVVRLV